MEVVKNLFEQNDNYQSMQGNEISSNLDKLDIKIASLRKEKIIRNENKIIKVVYTTIKQPFLIENDQGKLYINPDYYVKNQNEVEHLLSGIIKRAPGKEFEIISNSLITKNIIKSLSQSKTIAEVYLAINDKNKYTLTQEDYNILKKSTIKKVVTAAVAYELKDNFDPLIFYNATRILIGQNRYSDLSKEIINLYNKITKEELENLKYLQNSNSKIIIKEKNMDDAILITKRLEELGKENHVVINVNNKEYVTTKILTNDNYLNKNIDIKLEWDIFPIKEYIRFEKFLYQMIKPTKKLSPFEKYIYIYNTVKQYKQYKESPDDKLASRELYSILENEYMVCTGYYHLLEDLLNKVGIPIIYRFVEIDTSYDEKDENEIISSVRKGHSRGYVYIKDQKYGIDGFYVTDPTWDNNLEKDLYNHLLLTSSEETNTSRYNYFSTSTYGYFQELVNINSLEELYQKINFYLDRNLRKNLKEILNDLIIPLKKLDPIFIENLEKKYPELKKYAPYPNEKEILYEIGRYLLTKVNNPVSGEIIILAVSEVYQKAYHLQDQELQEKLLQTLKFNRKYQRILFPKRYKIDKYGNKIMQHGVFDKFDII